MIFRTATIAAVVATASYAAAEDTPAEPRTVCYEGAYDSLFPLDMGEDDCNGMNIFKKVDNKWKAARKADRAANTGANKKKRIRCPGGSKHDFAVLVGGQDAALNELVDMPNKTDEEKAAFQAVLAPIFEEALHTITDKCENALRDASEVFGTGDWSTVEDAGVDLDEFFAGAGFLNTETGNFQQDPADFKNNRDKYIYMGEDPRLNDHYPTTEESYQAGLAIGEMYTEESRAAWFSAPGAFEGGCASNTAMCCWHRDRQYFDDNGNCNAQDCANQNPGDNTDLCWTELDGEIFPYPGSATENSLHCHGLAWSNDESGIDMNAKGKWNTLFYVSMYDHLKQRGYAEGIGADPKIMSEQAMCGCVEDMAPVARADCSEIVGTSDYSASLSEDGRIEIEAVEDTFALAFQACEGFQFNGVTPDDFESVRNISDLGLKRKTNDLSAFVYRHWLERKITDEQAETVAETLIGYEDPSVNKSDANRAAACQAAFEERFPGVPYEEKEIEEA
jgi:hypothetical protein